MANNLDKAREDLVQELGRLSVFAGFNKAIGQIYGLLYLSRDPISLTEIADRLGMSKGNASLNIKTMERWGLIQPVNKKSDRKDYYQAETDFTKIIRDIINERDRKEIDHTLSAISSLLTSIRASDDKNPEKQIYQERLEQMLDFGKAADQMITAFLTMNNFRLGALKRSGNEKDCSQKIKLLD
jgi:HTH-type transcriptional regulator, glycine betaine synthesis regulator